MHLATNNVSLHGIAEPDGLSLHFLNLELARAYRASSLEPAWFVAIDLSISSFKALGAFNFLSSIARA